MNSCQRCARNKSSHQKRAGLLPPLERPDGPWQAVHVDFFGPLPKSGGMSYVLVVVDRFTRMAHLIACKDQETTTVLRHFVHDIVRLHGVPVSLTSDRGGQFASTLHEGVMAACGVKVKHTTSFHPASNGIAERVNQHIVKYLRIDLNNEQDNWAELLPLCELAYNNSDHSSIGVSPFFLSHGYHASTQMVGANVIPSGVKTVDDYVKRLKQLQETASKFNADMRQHMKESADKHRRPAPLIKVGDMVYLSRKTPTGVSIPSDRPNEKLDEVNMGPFEVLEVRDNGLNYKLALPPILSNHHDVFHVDRLTPVRPNTMIGRTPFIPNQIAVKDSHGNVEMQVEVEQILDFNAESNEYRVKYLHYPEPSWQPAANLSNCKRLLNKFHEERAKQDASSNHRSSGRPRRKSPHDYDVDGDYVATKTASTSTSQPAILRRSTRK